MKNLAVILGRTLIGAMLVMATPAWAQDTALTPAQKLFDEGKVAVEEKRLPDALKKLSDSYKLDPQPKTAAWLGRVQVDSGDYIAGATHLEVYLREEKELPEKAKQNVMLKQQEAKDKIVTVQLKGDLTNAAVVVDKQPIDPKRVSWPIFLVPGGHAIEVQKSGFVTFRKEIMAKPGEAPEVEVQLEREGGDGGPKKPGVPPLAIAGFAVTGGLLVTSLITGIVAVSANQKAADAALYKGCTTRPDCEAIYDEQYPRSATFTTVSLASLGVGVGVGVASLIYLSKSRKAGEPANAAKASWIAVPTPGGVLVQGSW